MNEKDRKKFEKSRKENAEQLGYKLTGITDIKESVNEINFSKISTPELVRQYKQMADERLFGAGALTFRLIAKELISTTLSDIKGL